MKFDLKRPCKHCPFVNTEHRITFACRERAEGIEETAFRQGFVCHEHGETVENEYTGESWIDWKGNGKSQHCIGALYMYLQAGSGNVPWERAIEEDEGLEERWWSRVDLKALGDVFESEETFIEANTPSD